LTTLLGAKLFPSASPESGMLLMVGEDFQAAKEHQSESLLWAKQPGCALILLPPYQEGVLSVELDWSMRFSSASLIAEQSGSLAAIVASEVSYELNGIDGGFDSNQGHSWLDHSVNTRYWKSHVNTGLIAATTLPIWSITLMNYRQLVHDWIMWFYDQTGKRTEKSIPESENVSLTLMPQDYTVMVCCYGWNVGTPAALSDCIDKSLIPIINLAEFDVTESFSRLQKGGFLDESGLSDTGKAHLWSSPYRTFAEHLKNTSNL
jgi:hypothetical protein